MKRYGKAKTAWLKAQARLSANDKHQLELFQALLNDWGKLPMPALAEKYGAEYLGLSNAELEQYTR